MKKHEIDLSAVLGSRCLANCVMLGLNMHQTLPSFLVVNLRIRGALGLSSIFDPPLINSYRAAREKEEEEEKSSPACSLDIRKATTNADRIMCISLVATDSQARRILQPQVRS